LSYKDKNDSFLVFYTALLSRFNAISTSPQCIYLITRAPGDPGSLSEFLRSLTFLRDHNGADLWGYHPRS